MEYYARSVASRFASRDKRPAEQDGDDVDISPCVGYFIIRDKLDSDFINLNILGEVDGRQGENDDGSS